MTTSQIPGAATPVVEAAPPAGRGIRKTALGAIVLGHLAVDMQTSSLSVLLPPLLSAFHLTYASAAGIISANNLVIAVAQPLFGVVGDYRRARWLVPLGCAVCGLAMTSVMYMPSYGLIIAAVILSGLGSAAFHPEALSSVRAVSGERTATASSIFFFGGNLGFAFGPLAAAMLLERWGATGLLGMTLPAAAGVTALWTQRRQVTAANPSGGVSAPMRLTWPRRSTLAPVGFLLVFIALRLAVSGGLQTFIPLYFSQHTLLTKAEIARLLTVFSIAGTAGTLFSGPLAERVGRKTVIVLSMAIALAALAVFVRSSGLAQIAALGVGGAMLSAPWTLSVIMMQEALPDNVGLASGLSLGTAYGAMGLAVASLGKFADGFGLPLTMQLIVSLPATVLLMGLFVPQRRAAFHSNPEGLKDP